MAIVWTTSATPAAAQTPAANPRDSAQPARGIPSGPRGTATIRGRVVDAATGHGLSRVEMRAGPNASDSVMTDGDGRYEIKELSAGAYTIVATKANYVRTSWGEARPEGPGKRIPITDGQLLEKMDLSLQRAGVVTGTILDEFGDPVTDVLVSTMRYQYVQGARRLMPAGHIAMTNDIGEFRIYGLSPGQYYVSATLRSLAVNVSGGDVSDRTGYAPTFYPGTGNIAEAQRLSVAAGQTVAGINLTLLPTLTVKVSGTALDAEGRPIPGAMLNVMHVGGGSSFTSISAVIRADGRFTLTGLTPGDYLLRIFGQDLPASPTLPITVGGSDINDVQLTAAKPSIIRGRVAFTDSATSAEPPKATAITLGAVREWAFGQPVRNAAKIADDGTFEISLPAGHVLLRAAPNTPPTPPARGTLPPAWRLNRVLVGDVDVGDSGIEVPANATVENVIVEMTNRSNELSGRVTDADGNIVRDCFVIVFAQDPAKWTVQTRYLSAVRPALDDLFHARLLPGDYYAVAMSDAEPNAWTDPEFLSLARERAVKFSIADGEKKNIDLPVMPAPVY